MNEVEKGSPQTLSLSEENNVMVDRLTSICNKVIPAFKQDFYMTPLRLNRDLKYGPATQNRVHSPSMLRESSIRSEIPLPPMDWQREMTCSGETSADTSKSDELASMTAVVNVPGANFLSRFLIN